MRTLQCSEVGCFIFDWQHRNICAQASYKGITKSVYMEHGDKAIMYSTCIV